MSILLAAASSTTMPGGIAPAPATAPMESASPFVWIFLAWAAVGLLTAYLIGTFRPASVLGPTRLAEDRSAFDLLVLLCASFGAQILGMMPVMRFLHLEQTLQLIVADLAGKVAGILVICVAITQYQLFGLKNIGLEPKRAGIGFMAGAAALFILYPLIQLSSLAVETVVKLFHLRQANPHQVLQILGNTPSRWLAISCVALAVIVAPLLEELFFRGLLQTALARLFGWLGNMLNGRLRRSISTPQISRDSDPSSPPVLEYFSPPAAIPTRGALASWLAILVTSALFAAIHGEPAFFAPLFMLSVGLGYAYERTGNLWVTITTHALFNGAQILIYLTER